MRGELYLSAFFGICAIGALIARKALHDRTDKLADRPTPPFPPAGAPPLSPGGNSGAPACGHVGRGSPELSEDIEDDNFITVHPVFPRDPVRRARWQSLFDQRWHDQWWQSLFDYEPAMTRRGQNEYGGGPRESSSFHDVGDTM